MPRSLTSTHNSRRPSATQGFGTEPDPLELVRHMETLSIPGESYVHPSNVSGGFNDEDSRHQDLYQEPRTEFFPPSTFPSYTDPGDQLREFLRPLTVAALPYVRPEDYTRAKGVGVIETARIAEQIIQQMPINPNTSVYPQNLDTASSQQPGYAESRFDTSRQDERYRRRHYPASQGGYIDVSGQSDDLRALSGRGSLPVERFERMRSTTARSRQETIRLIANPQELGEPASLYQPDPASYSSNQGSVARGYQDSKPPG